MGKIAFLYPGQGSQKVGMGRELLSDEPHLFERYLGRSNTVTGLPVTHHCLQGPISALSQTHIAQPALFAYSLALTEYAHRLGLYPDMVAGHSLGEYTAAVTAGVLTFDEGLFLVSQRGKLMHRIQSEQAGTMAAIIGLSPEKVHELCETIAEQHYVVVANINTPMQCVVSGREAGVLQLMEMVSAYDATRAIRLAVSGANHCKLMEPAQRELVAVTQQLTWNDARIPLAANVTASLLTGGEQIRQELIDQITSPVRWVNCVEALIDAGCDTFVELGSSRVLTGLVRSIAPEKTVFAADTPAKLYNLAASLRETISL